ncbi:hypothetical protein GGI19_000789 [Coemansia pectinata]|uniref:BolA-like protein n=1 Tax=Coemansia pectinata TaxID=1052879 RepID=A0A9W8H2F9_9FUNG|nr:hypothetical protein GGI19_000789 [Coemansia pectinata]
MDLGAAIYIRLTKDVVLNPALVEVVDMSGGCGGMFGVTVVSDAFQGLIPIKRHRMVHTVLGKEIKDLHAITLSLFTVPQYKVKNPDWIPAAQPNQGDDSAVAPSKGGGDQSGTALDNVPPPLLSKDAVTDKTIKQ